MLRRFGAHGRLALPPRLPFHHPRDGFHLRQRLLSRQHSSQVTGLPPERHFGVKHGLPFAAVLLVLGGTGCVAYEQYQPFRHSLLAVVRCSRVAAAAVLGVIDYKLTFARNYASEAEKAQGYSQCHTRSAKRVLKALLANGGEQEFVSYAVVSVEENFRTLPLEGVFIKLGQHMASLIVLPKEWRDTMRPLQDKCDPTSYEDVEALFLSDMGQPITELFEDFDATPIGVASLAQVHTGKHRESGKKVAVKLQHPNLAEFCEIDMEMVSVTLSWVKRWFPEFEFTWLGEEMRENLPKEMDFVNEAQNARRAAANFANVSTSLYIPEVISATKRVLIMEYIQGARVDDLVFLEKEGIDANSVALELASIFGRMVFVDGWFHADPHPGNLLIRRAARDSCSPYNFEIVLLDHGLYFDMDDQLRINYSKWWLSLIAKASPKTLEDRRKYAELVGNITSDLYPVFEAAITGRVALEGAWQDESYSGGFDRASSIIDVPPFSEAESQAIRNAVSNEGILLSVLDVLRRIPRRVVMVLKLNDLTRSLDHALATTHSSARIFLVTAKYCVAAVWQDDYRRIQHGLQMYGWLGSVRCLVSCWWRYAKAYATLTTMEAIMDVRASLIRFLAMWHACISAKRLQ